VEPVPPGEAEALGAQPPTLVHIPTDLLAQVVPKTAEWVRENFQFDNVFDNSAAKADRGFRCTVPWVEGARRMIARLDAHGQIPNRDDHPLEDRVLEAWQRLGSRMAKDLAALNASGV